MRARHLGEALLAAGRQADAECAPVIGLVEPLDQALLLELVDDRGDVAAGDHQQARELVHFEPLAVALELRHQVEARQRGAELLAQARAHAPFDELSAGEKPEPDPQRAMVVAPRDELAIHAGTPSLNRSSLKYLGRGCQPSPGLPGRTSLNCFFQPGSGGW